MVKAIFALVFAILAFPGWGDDLGLYGDGGGRIWHWSSGTKTYLTAENLNLTLGGVSEKTLWGWGVEKNGDRARFFTLGLPKGKGSKAGPPVFDKDLYPIPDRADRVGDRLLLVYNALSSPRWEVWQKGTKLAAKAYDDRVVYAAVLGPNDGWIVAGRTADGAPWLDVSGANVEGPEGWRGRMTVAGWVGDRAPTPIAAGWGAPSTDPPQLLFWEPKGWTQPAPAEKADQDASADRAVPEVKGAVYPVLGSVKKNALSLGGWLDDGSTKPWFWDAAATVPGGSADGEIQSFSSADKVLVVKHRAPPWFTFEDGKTSNSISGLGELDRVVAVEAKITR